MVDFEAKSNEVYDGHCCCSDQQLRHLDKVRVLGEVQPGPALLSLALHKYQPGPQLSINTNPPLDIERSQKHNIMEEEGIG